VARPRALRGRRRGTIGGLAAVLVGAAALSVPAAPAPAATVRVPVGDGLRATLTESRSLVLEVQPLRGEGLYSLARRLCATADAAREISRENGGVKQLLSGRRYRVAFHLLRPELKTKVVRALFRDDRPEPQGWRHAIGPRGAAAGESLWQVALWFTGAGENFAVLREVNGLDETDPRTGDRLLVPAEILLPEFRALLPKAPTPAPRQAAARQTAPPAPARPANPGPPAPQAAAPVAALAPRSQLGAPPASAPAGDDLEAEDAVPAPAGVGVAAGEGGEPTAGPAASQPAAVARQTPPAPLPSSVPDATPADSPEAFDLRFGKDAAGDFAVYALRPGEALYSSVVVRFTGSIHAEDVNALAREIAARSGIADVTGIPIGFPVKVPLDILLPEFLPAGHPRRVEYEASVTASARFRNQVTAVDLEGITVILDAGHGGRDVGASMAGVWESLYVYDVMLRVRRLLEAYTAATVIPTTRDGRRFEIDDRDVLGFSRGHAVLTTPPYPIEDSKVGVNLRWYLANAVLRRSMKRGSDSEKVVFVSIHADSLHPSLRGAMIYIPDAQRSGDFSGKRSAVYASRQEVRDGGAWRPSTRELLRSEGLSRELAGKILDALREENLPVHPFKPVREKVIRNRRQWVPAVLRYNAVPAKLLFEVCNLANAEDRELIQTRAYRQKVAESVVRGILSYYGPAAGSSVRLARAR
jgi:N-acetylmuramoyl-L-alanine amidase